MLLPPTWASVLSVSFKTENICPLGEYLGALLNSKYSLNRCFFRLMQMLFIVKLSA